MWLLAGVDLVGSVTEVTRRSVRWLLAGADFVVWVTGAAWRSVGGVWERLRSWPVEVLCSRSKTEDMLRVLLILLSVVVIAE